MGGSSDSDMSSGPLNASGIDFSDPDQASDFLELLLNDDTLKIIGNAYARYFWYGAATFIGLASVFNVTRRLILHQRLRAAAQGRSQPARPKSLLLRAFATVTAMGREATYLQLTPSRRLMGFRIPPIGTLFLIGGYLAFILVLEFINDSVAGAQFWEARGIRAGWLAIAQMPLVILLVGKNNLLTLTTGVSHERLNVLHRWSSRIVMLLAIFHFSFQSRAWSQFSLTKLEWATDSCTTTGIAAFAILLWMNLSTLAPLRYLSYEFFVVQHIITFFGFIIAIMFHLPDTALWSRIYIYIPIALYLVDRILRTAWSAWCNTRLSQATLVTMEGNVTRVTLTNPKIKRWAPGAWVGLSIPHFGWIQSHPATIVSTPTSHGGDMVFLLKSHKGFTRRIMTSANTSSEALLPHITQGSDQKTGVVTKTYHALLNGPYGASQEDFAAFDSVCLLAGSTGITFTLSLLQNIADRAALSGKRLPVRRIHFIWCVRSSQWAKWCSNELAAAYEKATSVGIEVDISIFVTCADEFTEQSNEAKECGCACDKTAGPCCCVVVDEDDGAEKEAASAPSSIKGAGLSEKPASTASSTIEFGGQIGTRLPILPCAAFYSGRPQVMTIVNDVLEHADGESGIAVCGSISLAKTVRNSVVKLSDQRAIHKGTSAQGLYIHVESFS